MRQNAVPTRLYCPKCGTIHSIYRKESKQKKVGHYKNFYCFKCKETHNHIELKDNDYTLEELEEMVEKMKQEGKF